MEYVIIDMPSSQPQHSSDSMPNNNGNNRSLALTGVGAQEKFVPITALLEMGASRLGVLACGWVVLMLVQGGIVVTVETKDRVSITVLFFLVCFRCWRYFYPQDTGSLTEATQSLSADNIQQLVLPIGFIKRLFYWWNLVSVMTCVVLSMKQLASQDFGQTEVANKGARNFALNVFYGLALTEALVLLFALTFITIMAMQRKVTEALIEWVKCQLYANSVGYSHLPESELDGLCRINELLSLSDHPYPKLKLKCLLFFTEVPDQTQVPRVLDLFSAINLSTLKHLYFNLECMPCLDLFPIINCNNLETLTLSWTANAKVLKKKYKLLHPSLECAPHQVLDFLLSLGAFLRKKKKYIHPSLECLHPSVSQPQQLLLKVDYFDDSEDKLPHLKQD